MPTAGAQIESAKIQMQSQTKPLIAAVDRPLIDWASLNLMPEARVDGYGLAPEASGLEPWMCGRKIFSVR